MLSSKDIIDRWLHYGKSRAKYPSLWDSSNVFASGPLMHEGGTLHDYSGRTSGAVWSVGAGDVPKYARGSMKGQGFWAGQWDGTDDYAYASDVSLPVGSAPRTVSFWLQSSYVGAPDLYAVSYGGNGINQSFDIGLFSSGRLLWTQTGANISTTAPIDASYPRCVSVTYPGGAGSNVNLFVDGNLPAQAAAGSLGSNLATALIGSCNLGRNAHAGSLYLACSLASVFIHSRVLTTFEISTLAQHPLAAYEVNDVPRYYAYRTSAAASPWLYARRSHMIGSGLGV